MKLAKLSIIFLALQSLNTLAQKRKGAESNEESFEQNKRLRQIIETESINHKKIEYALSVAEKFNPLISALNDKLENLKNTTESIRERLSKLNSKLEKQDIKLKQLLELSQEKDIDLEFDLVELNLDLDLKKTPEEYNLDTIPKEKKDRKKRSRFSLWQTNSRLAWVEPEQ